MKKIYLAIPYTGMRESSYKQATFITAFLISQNNNLNIFSPITHSHPLTQYPDLTVPGTWDYWSKVDYQFIDWADEVWVFIPYEGFNKILESTGVQAELKYAQKTNIPIKYIIWDESEYNIKKVTYEGEITKVQQR